MSRFLDKRFAQDLWIIQSRKIILPSVTSRTLSCSSASCLACWSGDRMAVKLSMSACFSERFLSSAAAAMLKIEGKKFRACEYFGGKIFEQDLTADQMFSNSAGAFYICCKNSAPQYIYLFFSFYADCKPFTFFIWLACEHAQAWRAPAQAAFLALPYQTPSYHIPWTEVENSTVY